MPRVLKREPQPNGLTNVTVDIDGVRTTTVQLVTATEHTLTDTQIEQLVAGILPTERTMPRK